ncbi:prepilin-type N-terminal cleavage/methylation domain-containing protein [Denitratisoma sp. DHT3]|uniref:pilus assembly FimT family protein n=1 Tax=Denitratisoma sp. DHT3 TaxID=1981880 RepID=UPI0011A04E24
MARQADSYGSGQCMPGKKTGFTLIEAVLTIVVLGILTSFVMTRFDFSGFDQRTVRDKVVASLQFARKSAVAQRRYVCVTLSPATSCTNANFLEFGIDTRAPETAGASFCDSSSALDLPSPDIRDCGGGGGSNRICCRTSASITSASSGLCFDPQGRGLNATCGAPTSTVITVTGQPAITIEGESGYVHSP